MATEIFNSAGSYASNKIISSTGINQIPFIGNKISGGIRGITKSFSQNIGGAIDDAIFGQNVENVFKGRRISDINIQTSSYGVTIPEVYGKAKVSGNIIYASPLKEKFTSRTVGNSAGKGGGGTTVKKEVRARYFISIAISICQGEIDGINRIWADEELVNLSANCTRYTIYKGSETQLPDPTIEALEGTGKASAYRGLAFIFIEDLDITNFGNRIPNFNFEVVRALRNNVDKVENLVKCLNIIPGCGEFVYDTNIQSKNYGFDVAGKWIKRSGEIKTNLNNPNGVADAALAIDHLLETFPNLEWASVVIAWYVNDLSATSTVLPRVEFKETTQTNPDRWNVGSITRDTAIQITLDGQNPIYGGTPSDGSILRFIAALKAKGIKVMAYPMVFVDKIDKPWRGRITGTESQINNFFTQANGYNAFIMHYANLLKNKVDAFVIGSEMKGLTQFKNSSNQFPAVTKFASLAQSVKTIMGANTKITYAADWSEYHSINGYFNMDELWSNAAIDFIGIDAYFPILDEEQDYNYDTEKAIAGWTNGEGYDWYYSDENRTTKQNLSPQYAWKNIEYWWKHTHTNPNSAQTAWVPESKKIWFTEYGFPSVDCALNQPNVFYNPDSVEGGLPYKSKGYVDYMAQRTGILATEKKWLNSNMIGNKFLWCFDARPYPYWPNLSDVWADGNLWAYGHWINGKLGNADLKDVLNDICEKNNLLPQEFDTTKINKIIDGFIVSEESASEILGALSDIYSIDIFESEGMVKFKNKVDSEVVEIDEDDLLFNPQNRNVFKLSRSKEYSKMVRSLTINYISAQKDYSVATNVISSSNLSGENNYEINFPVIINDGYAEKLAKIFLSKLKAESEEIIFGVSLKYFECEIGDLIKFKDSQAKYRITKIEVNKNSMIITATKDSNEIYNLYYNLAGESNVGGVSIPTKLYNPETLVEIFELPNFSGEDGEKVRLRVAMCGANENWSGGNFYQIDEDFPENSVLLASAQKPANMGYVANVLQDKNVFLVDAISQIEVVMSAGEIKAGSNFAIVGSEVIKFESATLVDENSYVISQITRGLFSTEAETQNHEVGEKFVIIDENLITIEIQPENLANILKYKAVSFGRNIEDSEIKIVTIEGNSIKNYAPVIEVCKNGGDILVNMTRRSKNTHSWALSDIPMSESVEKYVIDIIDNNIVRSTIITGNSFNYTATMQNTDFGGVLPANLTFEVAQISDEGLAGFKNSLIFSTL